MVSELKSGGDPIILSVTRDGKSCIEKDEVKKDDIAPALEASHAEAAERAHHVQGRPGRGLQGHPGVILEVTKTHVMGVSWPPPSSRTRAT